MIMGRQEKTSGDSTGGHLQLVGPEGSQALSGNVQLLLCRKEGEVMGNRNVISFVGFSFLCDRLENAAGGGA